MSFVFCESVIIKWRTGRSLCAAVKDSVGVHDITFTADGWGCSCGEDFCVHIAAVHSIAAVSS